MGLFDKMKTFVGVDAPKIAFTWLEDQIPVTDTGVKFKISVSSEKEYTVTGVSASLKAVYKNDERLEKIETLAEEKDNGENWIDSQNPFPGKIDKTNSWEYGGMVFMDDEKSALLQDLFANKSRAQLKLILRVTLDVKEVGMLFDPSIEKEIILK